MPAQQSANKQAMATQDKSGRAHRKQGDGVIILQHVLAQLNRIVKAGGLNEHSTGMAYDLARKPSDHLLKRALDLCAQPQALKLAGIDRKSKHRPIARKLQQHVRLHAHPARLKIGYRPRSHRQHKANDPEQAIARLLQVVENRLINPKDTRVKSRSICLL